MARVEEAETSDNAENQLNEEPEKASDGGSQAGDGGEEEEESEYEIESILDAKRGRFEKVSRLLHLSLLPVDLSRFSDAFLISLCLIRLHMLLQHPKLLGEIRISR